MNGDRRKEQKWVLNEQSLDKLLAALHPDRDQAGREYESIRRKLLTIFRCGGCNDCEACVDETLDRVARRLDGG